VYVGKALMAAAVAHGGLWKLDRQRKIESTRKWL
jgi:hypothetical protein